MGLRPERELAFQNLAAKLMGSWVDQDELHTYFAPATINEDGEDPTQGRSYPTPMLWKDWGRSRVTEEVRPGDIEVRIEQSKLAVVPELNGELDIDGERYMVVNVDQDPARAMWVLQGRLK